MPRNDGVEVRKLRIQQVKHKIMGLLHTNNGKYPLDKAIAIIVDEIGLTEKRIMEYAANSEKLGLFVIDAKNNEIRKAES